MITTTHSHFSFSMIGRCAEQPSLYSVYTARESTLCCVCIIIYCCVCTLCTNCGPTAVATAVYCYCTVWPSYCTPFVLYEFPVLYEPVLICKISAKNRKEKKAVWLHRRVTVNCFISFIYILKLNQL